MAGLAGWVDHSASTRRGRTRRAGPVLRVRPGLGVLIAWSLRHRLPAGGLWVRFLLPLAPESPELSAS